MMGDVAAVEPVSNPAVAVPSICVWVYKKYARSAQRDINTTAWKETSRGAMEGSDANVRTLSQVATSICDGFHDSDRNAGTPRRVVVLVVSRKWTSPGELLVSRSVMNGAIAGIFVPSPLKLSAMPSKVMRPLVPTEKVLTAVPMN